MDLLRQLGDLFLSAVPTVIIVYIFYFIFRRLFFLPLLAVMAKRESMVEGAQKQSEALANSVQEKQKAYRDGLRKARAEIFSEQDASRRTALDERAKVIREARTRATEQVHAAKARLAGEMETARKSLDASGRQLADDMARAVLDPAGAAR